MPDRLSARFRAAEQEILVLTEDDGRKTETKTRSEPWLMGGDTAAEGGHTAVILVEGRCGGYRLDRLEVVDA